MQAGDIVARRFRLVREEEYDLPGATRFVARDTRLHRTVTVDMVSSLAPTSVLRAARRAQLVRDRRLTRILAAGTEREGATRRTYLVSERTAGVRLDELVGTVAFLPATACAIIGEASATLRAAERGGLRHGMIRARSLTVTPRGRVVVSGLGVEHELASQAGLEHGRAERDDAIALTRLYVAAVTAMDADEVTTEDLPDDLPRPARALCEALLRGSGPVRLDDVIGALGTGNTPALRALVAEAPRLWWSTPPAPAEVAAEVAPDVAVDVTAVDVTAEVETAGVQTALEPDGETDVERDVEKVTDDQEEVEDEDHVEGAEEPVDASSTRLRTRFGSAVDDIDEFRDIIAAQDTDFEPSVMEAILQRLHQRFPRSAPLADLAAAAHRRAQTVPPFNIGPLLVGVLIVTVFVAGVIGAAMLTRPYDPRFDGYDNPEQTYPEYTHGQTPSPTAEG